jgi:hypothetical protein
VSSTPVVTVTQTTATTATVTWTPFAPGQYMLSWSGAGTGSQSPGSLPFTIPNLQSNANLTVSVSKIGACSGTSSATATTSTLCGVPSNVAVNPVTFTSSTTGASQQGLKVTWTGVSGATSYRVYYRPLTSNANWSYQDTSGTQKTIMPLYAGAPYAVMVAANNCPVSGQLGQPSPVSYVLFNGAASYTNPAPATCGPIPSILATSSCPNQITVNMTSGSGPWRVTLRRLTPSYTAGVVYSTSSTVTNFSVGTQFAGSTWEVFAQRDCGSSLSQISNVQLVNVKAACQPVTNLVTSHPTCYGFSVSWNGATNCDGVPVSNYQVYIKRSTQTNFTSYNVGLADHKTFPSPTLWANAEYHVAVRTVACNGAVSAISQVDTIVTGGPGCRQDEEMQSYEEKSAALVVYPNPSNGTFTVEVPGAWTGNELRLEVMNALGQSMLTNVLLETQKGMPEPVRVDMPKGAAAGLYLIRVTANGSAHTTQVMLQKD